MPDVSGPVTSPPALPWQPYDATAPGTGDDQSASATIYDPVPGDAAGGPWAKVQEGGAADWRTGRVTDGWPGNGTSSAGPWRQA